MVECGMRPIARAAAGLILLVPALLSVPGTAVSQGPSPGARRWVARFDGRADYDAGRVVAASPDGTRVFVAGSSTGTTGPDYATLAYDPLTGEQLWKARFGTRFRRGGDVSALAVSPDGTMVFVTGSIFVGESTYVWATVAYDASTGTQVWTRRYGAGPDTYSAPADLAVSPDGATLVVTGGRRWEVGSADYATVAYDSTSGAELWTRGYDGRGTGEGSDGAIAVALSPDGETVFVTGTSEGRAFGITNEHFATVAYDATTGSKLWMTWDRESGWEAVDLAVCPNGTMVFVTGDSAHTIGLPWSTSHTVAYDATTGEEIWTVRSPNEALVPSAVASIAVSPDAGTVFLSGTMNGRVFATVALDPSSGTVRWGQDYDGEPDVYYSDMVSDMAVSPDGSEVFITGWSGKGRKPDYATVVYEASSGTELWVRRYEGPRDGRDIARSIAVSPDGSRVFVTGESEGSTSLDFVTIAYSA
jgi:outer membrane protein assembly factor BamB